MRLLQWLILGLAGLGLAACTDKTPSGSGSSGRAGAPTTPNGSGPTGAQPIAGPVGGKPAEFKADFPPMSAEEYVKEFAANEEAAIKKFQDKKVVVEGIISEKEGNGVTASSLILAAHKSAKETINLHCALAVIDDYTAAQFKKLKVGDKVKINGEGSNGGVTRRKEKPSYVDLSFGKIAQ